MAADPKQPHSKRLAAKELISAHLDGHSRFGKRIGADSVDRVCDRTSGKPIAAVTITKIVEPDLAAVQQEIAALLESRPDLRQMIQSGELLSLPAPDG